MNIIKKLLLIILILLIALETKAQDTDVSALIKQGITLNNEKNYTGAIEKYKQALTAEPDNAQANYQLAYSLNASGKGLEGVPYLRKVAKSSSNFTGPAYELLGGIYDSNHQPQKAIDAYKEGVKIKPDYQPLYFNLGIACFRDKQYADAEQAAIEAIKLDPKHANSQRLYALVTFHQNKRAPALLGLCSFLLMEPDGPRAAEAYTNLQSIIKGGALKADDAKPAVLDADNVALNKALSTAIAGAKGAPLLQAQLTSVFTAIGQLAEKQTGNDFFKNYYAGFFYALSKSDNMPAFARLIGLSANKAENTQWLQQNEDKKKALDTWVQTTERKF